MFSVSTTHNLKIRELSDGNRELSYGNKSSEQSLSILTHTHTQGERGQSFKETNSDVYPKGPNF